MLNAQSSSLLSPPLASFVVSPASDTEQDAAVKLDQERAEIVAKYDKVRRTLPSVSVKAHRSFGEAENPQQLLFFFSLLWSSEAKFQPLGHAETPPNFITLW